MKPLDMMDDEAADSTTCWLFCLALDTPMVKEATLELYEAEGTTSLNQGPATEEEVVKSKTMEEPETTLTGR